MKVTLDTNLLVYSLDGRDALKQKASQSIVLALEGQDALLGLQACGELYHVTTRKLGQAPWIAAQAARNLAVSFPTFSSSLKSFQVALAEAASGRFSFWDANLLAAAEEAGCTHIISEDMADGARLGRLEIVAAFGPNGVSDRARALLQIEEA